MKTIRLIFEFFKGSTTAQVAALVACCSVFVVFDSWFDAYKVAKLERRVNALSDSVAHNVDKIAELRGVVASYSRLDSLYSVKISERDSTIAALMNRRATPPKPRPPQILTTDDALKELEALP